MTLLLLLDATVLTYIGLVKRPDLVTQLGKSVAIPRPVWEEYEVGIEKGIVPAGVWDDVEVLELSSAEKDLMVQLPKSLGKGERSCIAIALNRTAIIATDDKLARRVARHHGIQLTGTIGILAASVEAGNLSKHEAESLLKLMTQYGYRIPLSQGLQFLNHILS